MPIDRNGSGRTVYPGDVPPLPPAPHSPDPKPKHATSRHGIGWAEFAKILGAFAAGLAGVIVFAFVYFAPQKTVDGQAARIDMLQAHQAQHDSDDSSEHQRVDDIKTEVEDFRTEYEANYKEDHDLLLRIAGHQ